MLIEVEQLTKTYHQQHAVDHINLNIHENQCVALLGPNGAGKTTTLKMLSGLLSPTSGRIQFLGKSSIDKQFIGYLPQHPSFCSWMTAEEYLLFSGTLSKLTKKQVKEKMKEVLQIVGLEHAKNKKISGFSGGMKQRLGLAQAVIHEPKFLILDEPVSALDPSGRRDVLNIMDELKKKMTILFSTHVLHDAEQVCDDIIMLKDGKVKWFGSLQKLKEAHQEETFLLSTFESLKQWLDNLEYVQNITYFQTSKAEFKLIESKYRNRLIEDCIKAGLTILHFEQRSQSLEDVYMEVMGQ
ncbi:ABC transporter ATP-binding protein [Bacillus sp. 03113]|uniref:ABC transporter ATP-binding protein n=1 Tax=Bacillus sp. 03113 TaxID=2578211 RepID=UPI001144FFAC|nr:ABC transporter ATP-binding protein [Bacillus sp. 03113]